jgi:hypothetical protein
MDLQQFLFFLHVIADCPEPIPKPIPDSVLELVPRLINDLVSNLITPISRRKQGRPKKGLAKAVEVFFNKNKKGPRPANVNVSLMRMIKKLFSSIKKNQIKKISINLNQKDLKLLTEIVEIYHNNSNNIDRIFESENLNRSYNNTFLNSFFTSEVGKDCFKLFIDLIFSEINPEKLCRKFKFKCCRQKDHDNDCRTRWEDFKKYLRSNHITVILGTGACTSAEDEILDCLLFG